MSEYPYNTSGDADYWQLSNHQRWHYHRRVRDYHWRMVHSHVDPKSELRFVVAGYILVSLMLAAIVAALALLAWVMA